MSQTKKTYLTIEPNVYLTRNLHHFDDKNQNFFLNRLTMLHSHRIHHEIFYDLNSTVPYQKMDQNHRATEDENFNQFDNGGYEKMKQTKASAKAFSASRLA